MSARLVFLVLVGIFLGFDLANAQECISIADISYCCGADDDVCPEDYETPFGESVQCDYDPDCASYQCNDNLDNDNDGCSDYPTDLDCTSFNDNIESGPLGCLSDVCSITDAYWTLDSVNFVKPATNPSVDIGELGFLVVRGTNCEDETVDFSIDGVQTQPQDADFENGKAISYWIAEREGTYDFDFEVSGVGTTSFNSLVVSGDHNPLVDLYLTPSFARLKEDDSLQYETLACYLDGYCIDVTKNPLTHYVSDTPGKVSINANGLATAVCETICSLGDDIEITATFATVDDTADIEIGTDTEKVVVVPPSRSIKIGETANFDLYYYKNDDPGALVDGLGAVFSVNNIVVARVSDPSLGVIEGIGMGYTLVIGNYNGLSDDGFLSVDPNNDAPLSCGDGILDAGEQCEKNIACGDPTKSCYNCDCASYESVQNCDVYTTCIDGTKMVTNSCTGLTTEEGSCTPLSTSVPFFGWVHVLITLGLLTGYYVWKKRT